MYRAQSANRANKHLRETSFERFYAARSKRGRRDNRSMDNHGFRVAVSIAVVIAVFLLMRYRR